MKRLAYLPFTIFIFILLSLSACSSLDGDAKKAAELSKKSIDYAKDSDLQKAEELYKESQQIIDEYRKTDEYEEFQKAYNKYMHGELIND